MAAVRIEDRSLRFHIELGDCTFNAPGSYYARLSVQCAAREAQGLLKKVKVWSGDEEDLALEGVSMVTNTVDVSEANKSQPQRFTDNRITFRLPKGLCSPATSQQVSLLAEVFPYTDDEDPDNDDADFSATIGRSVFAIYPRTSTPFLKLPRGLGEGREELYAYRGTLNLRRTLSEGGLAVLGGRLSYALSLKLEPEPEIPPESPPAQDPTPTPAEPDPEPEPEPTPTPVPPVVRSPPRLRPRTTSFPTRTVGEDEWRRPRRDFNPRRGEDLLRESHISRPGKEEVMVIVHTATNLPSLPDGSSPRAYVAGISESPYPVESKPGICTTHSAQSASINPTWEEAIRITVQLIDKEGESGNQTMYYATLQIIDESSRAILLEYRLPAFQLQPFHVYHLDLVQNESHLFVSVQRRQPLLQRVDEDLLQSSNALDFHGLEVLLLGLEGELANPMGPLIAAARLLPDLFIYRQRTAQRNLQALNVLPLTVEYPDPHPSSFLLPSGSAKSNHPQVSLVSQSEESPFWNHAFLFSQPRELASIFTDIAALALQFYPATSAYASGVWSLHSPIAYCAQLLDSQVYQALRSARGMMGIRVILPLQGSDLQTKDGKTPRVTIVLRIITSMRPDSLPSASDASALPSLASFQGHELKTPEPCPHPTPAPARPVSPPYPLPQKSVTPPPVPLFPFWRNGRIAFAADEDELPSHDAVRDLLPSSNKRRITPPRQRERSLIPTRLPPPTPSPAPPHRSRGKQQQQQKKPNSAPEDGYQSGSFPAGSVMDSQQKEISNYREALSRMGEEIIRLQEHIDKKLSKVGSLEGDNGKLRQRINMFEDSTKAMSKTDDLDNITKEELLEKYVVVRQKLARQVSETASYRDKLLQLQNDMIKQNDREKVYLNQQEAAESSKSSDLDDKKAKIKKLEKTCREQEKALEKMEQMLMSKQPKSGKHHEEPKKSEAEMVAAENERLKAQIEQIRTESANKAAQRNQEGEKLMLQVQLEKAKGRVQSLERELTEKARDWGKQKESVRLRMGEQHPQQHPHQQQQQQQQQHQQQNYNQRALPPLRDRGGYNQHDDEEMDRGYKGMHQQSPNVSNPFY